MNGLLELLAEHRKTQRLILLAMILVLYVGIVVLRVAQKEYGMTVQWDGAAMISAVVLATWIYFRRV